MSSSNANLTPCAPLHGGACAHAAITPTAASTTWHPAMLLLSPMCPPPPPAGRASLTHPHVSETSHAEFLIEVDGFPRYFPGVLS